MAAPLPGRCRFFVKRKKRFCKMMVGRGKTFCGEHDTESGDVLRGQQDTEDGGGAGGGSRRIVCPLDPKHTVSEDKLHKHLKKCNAREKPPPVYFVRDRNCGSGEDDATPPQVSLCERSRSDLERLIEKLKAATEGLPCEVKDCVLSHPVLEDELNDPKNGDSAHKHLRQQSSILGHLEQLGLLGGGRCFVEFGAGRGKLSHWIHRALQTCRDLQVLLVERSTTRFKVDGKHQEDGVHFERLQVDIQHLDLSKVPLRQRRKLPLVAVGKHLCGAATDLALRCLLENPGSTAETEPPHKRLRTSEPEPEPEPDPDPGADQILGLVVALCCHHRCEWRHYVGRPFFRARGLGAEEFAAFCRMSSWATCGLRATNQDHSLQNPTNHTLDEEEHEPAADLSADSLLPADERLNVGRLCKLLIDAGRRDFLRRKGFSGELSRYVDAAVTLENVLLTAVPHTAPC